MPMHQRIIFILLIWFTCRLFILRIIVYRWFIPFLLWLYLYLAFLRTWLAVRFWSIQYFFSSGWRELFHVNWRWNSLDRVFIIDLWFFSCSLFWFIRVFCRCCFFRFRGSYLVLADVPLRIWRRFSFE
jgi:hypothetical protein